MISTRMHGIIDYAVAALFGGLAASNSLTPSVRRVLGAAGAVHAGYSAITDYEAGLRPRLSMRQHLLLDAAVAGALGAAGILMRRQSPSLRAMLVGAALAELTVVGFSSVDAESGPGQGAGAIDRILGRPMRPERIGYPPLDTPKQLAPNIYIVDSMMSGVLGAVLPVRMTVIRLSNGDLVLHSPTRFSPALRWQLEAIGPIRHLVAPNSAHWMFLRDWQTACPEATTWAAPGLQKRRQVRKSHIRLDRVLPEGMPADWHGDIALITVPGGLGFRETALYHQPTRTLVLTDLVLNLEAPKVPALLRPVVRLFGSMAPGGMPPPYLRGTVKLRRKAARAAARRLLDLEPERVIFAHGQWFERDGTARLRRSLRWLVESPAFH